MGERHKRGRRLLSAAVALVLLAGCGGGSDDAAAPVLFRLANTTANDAQEELGQLFVDRLNEVSGGRINAEFYSAGSLGENIENLQSIQAGGLEGNIAPTAWLSPFVPEIGVLSLPFLFQGDSIEEIVLGIAPALQGEAGDLIRAAAQEKGFRLVALWGIGPEVVYSRSPIPNLAAMRRLTFRVLPGDVHSKTFANWGVQGTAIPFGEVYTSVQQGVIDGGENPPDVLFKSGFHEVGPNIIETYHNALISHIVISQPWYDALPADLKAVVDQVSAEIIETGSRRYAEAQQTSFQALIDDPSVTVSSLPAADLAEMERLNRAGVWADVLADPVLGPVAEAFLRDLS